MILRKKWVRHSIVLYLYIHRFPLFSISFSLKHFNELLLITHNNSANVKNSHIKNDHNDETWK